MENPSEDVLGYVGLVVTLIIWWYCCTYVPYGWIVAIVGTIGVVVLIGVVIYHYEEAWEKDQRDYEAFLLEEEQAEAEEEQEKKEQADEREALRKKVAKLHDRILPQIEERFKMAQQVEADGAKKLESGVLSTFRSCFGVLTAEQAKHQQETVLGKFHFRELPVNIQVEVGRSVLFTQKIAIEAFNKEVETLQTLIEQADQLLTMQEWHKHHVLRDLLIRCFRSTKYEVILPKRYDTNFEGKPLYRTKEEFEKEFNSDVTSYSSQIIRKYDFVVILPEHLRLRNLYMLGASGSGKSYLMLVLLYHHIKRFKNGTPDCGVVLIDPHGDLAQLVTRFKLFQEQTQRNRLVYLSAEFATEGKSITINPFEHDFHDLEEQERRIAIGLKASELQKAFLLLFKSGEISENMRLLLMECSRLLLEFGGSLHDLLDLLIVDSTSQYLALASSHWDSSLVQYFEEIFPQERLNTSKSAIYTRMKNMISSSPTLDLAFLGKRSSFNLGRILSEGGVLNVNASQGQFSQDGSKLLAGFILADLVSFAFGRANIPPSERKRVFLYVDEVHNYVSSAEGFETILSQTRKYGLHIGCIAHQYTSQLSRPMLDGVLGNTEVKIVGKSAQKDLSLMSKNMQLDLSEVENLQMGKFAIKSGSHQAVVVQVDPFLLLRKDHPLYLSDEASQKLLEEQKRKYYRTVEKALPSGSSNPKNDPFTPEIEDLI